MTREEDIKAAILVTPESITFATPEINFASQKLAENSGKLVDWIHSSYPFLYRHEAILLTAAIIESIPELLQDNPVAIHGIQGEALMMVANREYSNE